jgi:hypothetical protein
MATETFDTLFTKLITALDATDHNDLKIELDGLRASGEEALKKLSMLLELWEKVKARVHDFDEVMGMLDDNKIKSIIHDVFSHFEPSNIDKNQALKEILQGAHVQLLGDRGRVYDWWKDTHQSRDRLSSHYNDTPKFVTKHPHQFVNGTLGAYPDCSHREVTLLFGKTQMAAKWVETTWLQLENAPYNSTSPLHALTPANFQHTLDCLHYLAALKQFNIGPCRRRSKHTDKNPLTFQLNPTIG